MLGARLRVVRISGGDCASIPVARGPREMDPGRNRDDDHRRRRPTRRISLPTTRLTTIRVGLQERPGAGDRQFRRRLKDDRVALPAQQPDQRDAGIAVRQVQLQRLAFPRLERAVDIGGDLLLVGTGGRPVPVAGACPAQQRGQIVDGHLCLDQISTRRIWPARSCYTDTSRRFALAGAWDFTISASASSAAWIWRLARNGSGSPVNRAISSSVRSCW